MVDALLDLEQLYRSKREQISLKEAHILKTSMARRQRDFFIGLFGGSGVTWLATQRVRNPLRSAFIMTAGFLCGLGLATRSYVSSVDHILSLKGSRIQTELANAMLKKNPNHPFVRRILSRHFYCDEVYNDSSGDRPVFRWRHKNFSGEVTRDEATSYGKVKDPKEDNAKKTTATERQQVYASAAAAFARAADDSTENPFDLIFGRSESKEDAPQQDTPTTPSKRQTRKERRSRRKHRRHHLEESESDM